MDSEEQNELINTILFKKPNKESGEETADYDKKIIKDFAAPPL